MGDGSLPATHHQDHHVVYMQSQIMGHRSEVAEQIKKDQQKALETQCLSSY